MARYWDCDCETGRCLWWDGEGMVDMDMVAMEILDMDMADMDRLDMDMVDMDMVDILYYIFSYMNIS